MNLQERVLVVLSSPADPTAPSAVVDAVRRRLPSADLLIVGRSRRRQATSRAGEVRVDPQRQMYRLAVDEPDDAARLLAGLRWASSQEYSVIAMMPADGTYHPDDLVKTIRELRVGSDIVVGRRTLRGLPSAAFAAARQSVTGFDEFLGRSLGVRASDPRSRCLAMRARALSRLDLDSITATNDLVVLEILARAAANNLRIGETTIDYYETTLDGVVTEPMPEPILTGWLAARVDGCALWLAAVADRAIPVAG